jgi:mono/diheme cytochrome c family protein
LSLPHPAFRTDPFPSTIPERSAPTTVHAAPRWPRRLALLAFAVLALLLLLALGRLSAQEHPTPRPPGVTDSAIAWGQALFNGSANCVACHGAGGRGTDRGPNLTGGIWFHGPGTYDWLIQQVIHGVPADKSVSGEAMPMRGWVPMNDMDVRAVAAYVWSISHPPQPPPKPQPVPGAG